MSCLIGNTENRLLIKEYSCSKYALLADIHRTEHKIKNSLHTFGTKSPQTPLPSHLAYMHASPPNVSVAIIPQVNVTSCYIFKYLSIIESDDHGKQMIEYSVHANFSCDYRNMCASQAPGTVRKTRHKNRDHGDLYCCNQNNCNKEDVMEDLPPKQQLCYNGSSDGYRKTAAVEFCTQPDTQCARARRIRPDVEEEFYFCDNLHHCQNYSLINTNTSGEMCKVVIIDNKEIELCCCSRSKCYKPSWFEQDGGAAIPGTNHILHPAATGGLSWLFIGGLVLLALMCTAVISAVMLGIRRCRRKARDNVMTFTYTRLTISVPNPEDREDIQMLLD